MSKVDFEVGGVARGVGMKDATLPFRYSGSGGGGIMELDRLSVADSVD